MSDSADFIELNGKRYSVATGQIADESDPDQPEVKKIKVHTSRRHTERPKTLMRQAVKKPSSPRPPKSAAQLTIKHKKSGMEPDPEKLERAKNISKHESVKRFGVPDRQAYAESIEKPVKAVITEVPVKAEPVQPHIKHESHLDLQQAIDQAISHTQVKPKLPSKHQKVSRKLGVSPKATSWSAAALAAVLLIGFFAYQNIANMSMRVATAKSGVPGHMPAYQPPGFGQQGPISYSRGQITMNFKSHSDSRNFRLHQRSSNWNSTELIQNYLAPQSLVFQIYQSGDKTVYVYKNHNATWVADGVWYQVEGNSSLTSSQLLRLAASL